MQDYKVKDLSQAEFGRKEISLAETEMPGLMALRKEYKGKSPLKGAKILVKEISFSRRLLVELILIFTKNNPSGLISTLGLPIIVIAKRL